MAMSQGPGAVLVAVVEAGTFSGAAQRLGITKSAVSKRIALLEATLGVRLLQRTTRSLSLTEAGERFYAHASTAVEAMDQAERAATELQEQPRGRLRVVALMAFARLHLVPRLPEFAARYPDLGIDLVLDDHATRIAFNEYDVALRAGVLQDSTFIARKLAPLRSVVCASPGYLERHASPQRPQDLLAHECFGYSYSTEATTWTFRRNGRSQSVDVTGSLQINNSEALCEVVLRGMGIARLPTFIAAPHIAEGRLVALLPQYTMPSKDLHVVFAERTYLPQKVRVFIDFVVDAFGGDVAPWDLDG